MLDCELIRVWLYWHGTGVHPFWQINVKFCGKVTIVRPPHVSRPFFLNVVFFFLFNMVLCDSEHFKNATYYSWRYDFFNQPFFL